MPKPTKSQNETVDRVMHAFKKGQLESGPSGQGGKVKSRKQAIAIALNESGESSRQTPARKTRAELYVAAKARNLPGRSTMTRAQLERALSSH